MSKPVCVIVGVGPGNGAALAARFAQAPYQLALLARSTQVIQPLADELNDAHAYACDVSDEASIQQTFAKIREELGDIEVVVYNAGSGSWGSIEDITPDMFEANWRVNAWGLMQVSQQVIPSMKKNGRGNIVVIGATASKRGNVRTAAFAPAKAAQRSLAESMARSLWPAGIHVSLVIVDGVIDIPKTRERMPDKADSFFIQPAAVADTVFWLTQQAPSAWSFEVEVRPFGETW